MKIIACLGNPGRKYNKNRHNTGFIIGKEITKEFDISLRKKSFHSHYGTGKIDGEDILLLLPATFMNKSGLAVKAALQYYNEDPDNLIVVHDEIELPFGEIRTKFGGGHKGHNGIRSITQELNTADFHRLRVGVGRPSNPAMEVADYLLSNFTKDELKKIEELSPAIIDQIRSIITSTQ